MSTFLAIYLDRTAEGETRAALRTLSDVERPQAEEDDVTVHVHYSTLNYKDALAITGASPVVRRFPMVAGIDFSGRVIESRNARWTTGDDVVLTGWHAGETHWGGLSQRAWVPADCLIKRPLTLTLRQTMAIGTAGLTAALCLLAIERHHVEVHSGEILVTGATGGVGSLAIMLLAARGFHVVAATGKLDSSDYLRRLGAAAVIDRATLGTPGRPLQPERWAAAIDTVGSHTLANVCATTRINGIVAACGLAQGMDFPATVAPFILRGVTLAGINSIFIPLDTRLAAWARLEELVDRERLDAITEQIPLSGVIATAPRFLAAQVTGRIVVDVNA
jgi:acrylyl-CoA reductase (NADPH)